MISQELGKQVDDFLDFRKSANYLECSDCMLIVDMPKELPKDWKFSMMGLIPSKYLKTVQGLCPTCQEMRKQFKGILSQ